MGIKVGDVVSYKGTRAVVTSVKKAPKGKVSIIEFPFFTYTPADVSKWSEADNSAGFAFIPGRSVKTAELG